MKKIISILTAAMLLSSVAACKKKDEQQAAPQQQQTTEAPRGPIVEPAPQGHGAPGEMPSGHGTAPVKKMEFQVVVPPDVQDKWPAVRFVVEDRKQNRTEELTASIGGEMKIPGSNLTVKVGPFLPDFTMTAGTITSASGDLNNPAVGVVVYENGTQIFPEPGKKWGWLWSRKELQMMHPFQHERFALMLKEGVAK
ncbi:MAG: hypothetical protein C4560_13975 [Nitrospiraceae bacterium]|nr:MAG: hypothetical protein C4560_13975 [Nitrospiraceae bacterium]